MRSQQQRPIPAATPVDVGAENFRNAWRKEFEKMLSELEVNQSLWQSSGVMSYRFVAEKRAGGNTNEWNRLPVVITVEDGNRTSIKKQSKDQDYVIYSRTDGFEDFDTFDKLFDYLRRELQAGRMVRATYDKKLGYPKWVGILISYSSHGGRSIKISEFERAK
jgi:hypothetical protein